MGNNGKEKAYPCVSNRPALHAGDILSDLAEQRQRGGPLGSKLLCVLRKQTVVNRMRDAI